MCPIPSQAIFGQTGFTVEVSMTEELLTALRADVEKRISPYRMQHTLGVEQMAARLAALYCPEKTMLLRAAALLHDVTKELPDDEQLRIFAENGVTLRPDEQASPKVWHGMSAALIIPKRYPELSDAELLSAVRWHTTGRAGMTLCDALLYLADIIEEGREFADCVALRHAFFDPEPERMSTEARMRHLGNVLLLSYENLIPKLQARGSAVCLDSLAAWGDLTNRTEI